ncbi:MAG TPA: ParB/RepB/Spo0J family partition protein [Phycisphaerales bacterium]|nr:ParB/RepB/Spo0J family partition protein [Phycisphaerales bacterium]
MLIALSQLQAHPHNANVMPEGLLAKLAAHIRETGRYPALIVRPMGGGDRHYQILDGHHRALALRRLGHDRALCEVWDDVDDQQAAILLLTLNRLRGEDDPFKRGGLMAGLALERPRTDLARLLPDELARIDRLMALATPALAQEPQPQRDRGVPQPPRSLTFFLDAAAYEQALLRLRELDSDRTRALLKALTIDGGVEAGLGAQPQRGGPGATH